jgi:hypothetical protein
MSDARWTGPSHALRLRSRDAVVSGQHHRIVLLSDTTVYQRFGDPELS